MNLAASDPVSLLQSKKDERTLAVKISIGSLVPDMNAAVEPDPLPLLDPPPEPPELLLPPKLAQIRAQGQSKVSKVGLKMTHE